MKFREFEGGGVVGAIFQAEFEGGGSSSDFPGPIYFLSGSGAQPQ